MKKANKILSVLLTMCLVLSLAAFSVSAMPADYTVVDGNRVFVDFEDSNTAGFTAALGSIALSNGTTEPAFSGSRSLKISMHTDGWTKVKVEPKNIPGSDFGFEKGKTYYISFWLNSTSTKTYHYQAIPGNGGSNVGAPPYNGSNMSFNYNCKSGTALNAAGWIKGWTTYTVDGSGTQTFWQFIATLNAGDVIYLDNIEIAEVDGTTKTNDVPAGATAVTTGKNGAEMIGTGNFGKQVITNNSSTVTQDFTTAHYGEGSWKIEHTAAEASAYFKMDELVVPVDNAPYYYSFYAMSPEAGTKVQLVARKGWRPITEEVELVPNVWTKISALYTHQEDEIADAYRHLNVLRVVNADETPVAYIDDIVAAKLSAEPAAVAPVLTQTSIDYDFNTGNATVVFTSSDEIKSLANAMLMGADTMTLGADGKTITITASGLTAGQDTQVMIAMATDIYGRSIDMSATIDVPTLEEAPMTISSSSVVDGATDVAPVKELYFKVPYSVDEATVIAGNFSIEGYGASIETVEKVADTEIKVTLDGIWPAETYTLTVDGVANTSGGVLTDTITFTTKAADYSYNVDFEGDTLPSAITYNASESSSCALSTEKAHNGSNQSVKLVANNQYGGFAKINIGNLKTGVPYLITFWYYSDTWAGNTANSQWAEYGEFTFSSTQTGQWNKVQVVVKSLYNGINLSFWGLGIDGVIYVDDVEAKELCTSYQPTIRANGEYVQALAIGENTVDFTVNGAKDGKTVTAFVVTYGEKNRMLSAIPTTKTVAANADETFSLTVTKTAGVTTKVIVMDANNAPLYDVIQ